MKEIKKLNEILNEEEQAALINILLNRNSMGKINFELLKKEITEKIPKKVILLFLNNFLLKSSCRISSNDIKKFIEIAEDNLLFQYSEVKGIFLSGLESKELKKVVASYTKINEDEYIKDGKKLFEYKGYLSKNSPELKSQEIKLYNSINNASKPKLSNSEKLAKRSGRIIKVEDYSIDEVITYFDSFDWWRILNDRPEKISEDLLIKIFSIELDFLTTNPTQFSLIFNYCTSYEFSRLLTNEIIDKIWLDNEEKVKALNSIIRDENLRKSRKDNQLKERRRIDTNGEIGKS